MSSFRITVLESIFFFLIFLSEISRYKVRLLIRMMEAASFTSKYSCDAFLKVSRGETLIFSWPRFCSSNNCL